MYIYDTYYILYYSGLDEPGVVLSSDPYDSTMIYLYKIQDSFSEKWWQKFWLVIMWSFPQTTFYTSMFSSSSNLTHFDITFFIKAVIIYCVYDGPDDILPWLKIDVQFSSFFVCTPTCPFLGGKS